MKKTITLLLAAILLLPLSLNAKRTTLSVVDKSDVKKSEQMFRTGAVKKSTTVAPIALLAKGAKKAARKADVPEGYASVTFYAPDVWGDGSGYQMLLDADAEAYGTIIPENGGLTSSGDASAEVYDAFEYKIPENADGALNTENILIDEEVTILIPAGIYDGCFTNPTPGDRVWIASFKGEFPGRFDDFNFKSGVAYYFYIDIVGSNDAVFLEIDDPNAPKVPENIEVVPGKNSAKVSWVEINNAEEWNLRYRPLVPDDKKNYFWDLNDDSQFEGWLALDADGDGYNWGVSAIDDEGTDFVFFSASYYNGAALTPDNWLISPEIALGGELSFDAFSSSPSYPDEVFQVYVLQGEFDENTTTEDFEAISEEITSTADITNYKFDLSGYEGKGRFAIRHFNCSNQYYFIVDNIKVEKQDGMYPFEWSEIDGIAENPFTLEGLEEDTEYELQLQSVKGEETSAWSESVEFTTGGMPEFKAFVYGSFNNWDTENPAEANCFKIDMEKGTVILPEIDFAADDEFLIFASINGDGMPIGASSEEEYFLIDDTQLKKSIALVPGEDGKKFHIAKSSTYQLELKNAASEELFGAPAAEGAPALVITDIAPSAIKDINLDDVVSVKYVNVAGQVSATPFEGVNVMIMTKANGTTKIVKVIK